MRDRGPGPETPGGCRDAALAGDGIDPDGDAMHAGGGRGVRKRNRLPGRRSAEDEGLFGDRAGRLAGGVDLGHLHIDQAIVQGGRGDVGGESGLMADNQIIGGVDAVDGDIGDVGGLGLIGPDDDGVDGMGRILQSGDRIGRGVVLAVGKKG